MYRLPVDIQRNLRNKFPDIEELDSIVNAIIDEICEKTFNDGSCSIYKFGTFYSYKAYSSKRGKFVPRFKFQVSRTFLNNLLDDEYTIQKITKTLERVFNREKEKNTDYQNVRKVNQKNQSQILNSQKIVREKTEERIVKDEIAEILNKEG